MKEILKKLASGYNLTGQEAAGAASELMDGKCSEAETASFLTALRMKGETAEEIASIASAMRERCTHVRSPPGTMDLCGTGGARVKTFNVSTVSSIVVAAAGVPVAKHGNRSFTSRSGSADLLESLGVNISIEPEKASAMLNGTGITFLFAPLYHPAMKNVIGVRKALGFRTIFNILGPISNPAGIRRQLIGVFSDEHVGRVAGALMKLGTERAIVLHGSIGMDEISPSGRTVVEEVRNGSSERYEIDGSDFADYGTGEWKEQLVSDPADSAAHALRILENGATEGERSIVLLNAGAALYVSGRCSTMEKGVEHALDTIESGRALAKLREFALASDGHPEGGA